MHAMRLRVAAVVHCLRIRVVLAAGLARFLQQRLLLLLLGRDALDQAAGEDQDEDLPGSSA